MEINELFIGAWVLNGGMPAQVTGITCDGILGTTAYRCTNIERVEPIPLTPEILEKNGFVCKGAYCIEGEDIGLRHNGDSFGVLPYYANYDSIPLCSIKYFHQLQQLLCLCEIDIEIKL